MAQCTAHGTGSALPLPQGRLWAANPSITKAPNCNPSALKSETISISEPQKLLLVKLK